MKIDSSPKLNVSWKNIGQYSLKHSHTEKTLIEMDRDGSRTSLVDEIASVLAAEIIGSRYAPGERILHHDLTKRFNVSFGPVREALLKLEQERLVEILPRRGARVIELTLDQIEDVMAIRCAIYPVIARSATVRGSAEQLEAFRQATLTLAKALRSSEKPDKLSIHAYRAGLEMSEASGNRWAGSIARSTTRQPNWGYSSRSIETKEERRQAAVIWEALGKAVANRDTERAALLAEAMALRTARTTLPKLYAEHGLDKEEVARRLQQFPTTPDQ